ncbi:MAG: DEAD/DEAH box helicase, partial [Planctomycetaceae bacterium]|nr:DEAD/DEAH box helicase [Planctomycetaceae bacterium]
MTAFDSLAFPVQKWVRERGWKELRAIQAESVTAILGSTRDLIISASTAGGKTEAAFLPLISQMTAQDAVGSSGFGAVYIGPLKALINDQHERLEDICRHAEIAVVPWHGDVSASVRARAQKNPSGILLITPESLEALFVRKGSLIPTLFGNAEAVVIDELHTFLDSERGVQLRSLLTRLELAISHKVRRIGLSATLGSMELAKTYLRREDPENVQIIESSDGGAELRLQVRGYSIGTSDEAESAANREISDHLFSHLRGSNNLVFAGSRGRVESFSDSLRRKCESERLPQEFYPHHANLSKDHR